MCFTRRVDSNRSCGSGRWRGEAEGLQAQPISTRCTFVKYTIAVGVVNLENAQAKPTNITPLALGSNYLHPQVFEKWHIYIPLGRGGVTKCENYWITNRFPIKFGNLKLVNLNSVGHIYPLCPTKFIAFSGNQLNKNKVKNGLNDFGRESASRRFRIRILPFTRLSTQKNA